MSGPKTSNYSLTPEQRQILMEQLKKAREERIKREKLAAAKRRLEMKRKQTSEFVDGFLKIHGLSEVMKDKLSLIQNTLLEAATVMNTDDISDVELMSKKLGDASEQLQHSLSEFLEKEREETRKENEKIDGLIARGFRLDFKKLDEIKTLDQNSYYKLVQESLEHLTNMHMTKELTDELDRIRAKAHDIDSIDFLENFYVITVLPFVKKCQEHNDYFLKYKDEYYNLYAEYRALMEEEKIEPDISLEEFSVDNLSFLKEEVKTHKNILLKQEEEAYISKAIDEAMCEMGYVLVGQRDIVKKSGRRTHKELYHFADGTVVDVTFANNGQITMELGAVDQVNRIPLEEEAEQLTEDMIQFCQDFGILEDLLKKKGVNRKNISVLPPSTAYAQVINISDYQMTGSVDDYEIDKIDNKKKIDQRLKYMKY